MRILVTGANGYLGGRISEHLANQGNDVIALIHHQPDSPDDWLNKMERVIEGDATSRDILLSAMETEVDCVIFAISLDHRVIGKDPFRTLAVNVGILWELLEIYAEKGGGKLIYLSTQQVYGRRSPGDVIREEDILQPVNAYGMTHKFCEDLCELYSRERELNCISVRISNSFGTPIFPSCNCWWLVINDLCKTAWQQGELRLLSDGTPQRDFVAIPDVCQVMETMANLPVSSLSHPVYNLGSGKAHTILEIAHEVSNVCKDRYSKEFPVLLPDGTVSRNANHHRDMPRFKYDISRLKEIGFNPSLDLRPGIEEVLSFLDRLGDSANYL